MFRETQAIRRGHRSSRPRISTGRRRTRLPQLPGLPARIQPLRRRTGRFFPIPLGMSIGDHRFSLVQIIFYLLFWLIITQVFRSKFYLPFWLCNIMNQPSFLLSSSSFQCSLSAKIFLFIERVVALRNGSFIELFDVGVFTCKSTFLLFNLFTVGM